jgi:cellulose synthase/poly-beta-1,6-N-acetylglucosamine synthase-like glycosyltransferase
MLFDIIALYFITISIGYGLLVILSWFHIKQFNAQKKKQSPLATLPSITFIIPAFNESSLIVETLQTYMQLPQKNKEIIVIDDGSQDPTFRLLQTMYQLTRCEKDSILFRSITHPELKVVEAPHMGKSQALNLGIAYSTFDLVCTMDADTIPFAPGIDACLDAFGRDPHLLACGGVIQILHSQRLKNNNPLMQKNERLLPSFQRLEYLRSFVCERLGWSLLGGTMLISGAFCMLRKECVQKVGGFNTASITEDFDLIVRMRKMFRGYDNRFKILPVTTCHTQVPVTLKHLRVQRIRWQLGLVQTLSQNFSMTFSPAYGIFGLLSLPYMWIVETASPLIEIFAYVAIPYMGFLGIIRWEVIIEFTILSFVYHVLITWLGIHLDRHYITKDKSWSWPRGARDSILMHLGYKQMYTLWRLYGIFMSIRSKNKWGESPREEIVHQRAL